MKQYVKNFFDFVNESKVNEGTEGQRVEGQENSKVRGINVYKPGDPYKLDTRADGTGGKIQWTGVEKHFNNWMNNNHEMISIVCNIDANYDRWNYDELNINPKYKSKFLGTWNDDNLKLFSEDFPRYNKTEFDVIGLAKQEKGDDEMFKYKDVKISFVKVQDMRGNMFVIPPFEIIDIERGNSIVDQIMSGDAYLVGDKRAIIDNYQNKNGQKIVTIRFKGDNTTQTFTLADFRSKKYLNLTEV
jgi:hypothetical protein